MPLKHLTVFAFLLVSAFAKAQVSQIKIANNSLAKLHVSVSAKEDAKKQLSIIGEGIKAIEVAEKDNRTKNWPETWAIKSYLSSYIAIIDENTSNADKYFQLAQDALTKAKKADKYQSTLDLIGAAEHNIHTKMQREGSLAYNKNDFQTAYSLLKQVSDYFPKDTLLATNTAICAQNLQQYDDALAYYLRAKDNGVKNPAVYQQIANIYTSKFENELAAKTLEDAIKIAPFNSYLTNDFINLLLESEQYTKAATLIESSLLNDKRNATLQYLRGYLEQNFAKNTATAESSYKKALEIDQNYFEALYQLGLTYLNDANDALSKKDERKFKSYTNRAEYTLLKAHDININHRNTIKLLIDIYTRKNRLDKVQDLKRKLNEF